MRKRPLMGGRFFVARHLSTGWRVTAWRTTPSLFVVAQQDQVINPELERFFAKRMGSRTIEIKASHAVFMSHPKEIAAVIESAARDAAVRTQP